MSDSDTQSSIKYCTIPGAAFPPNQIKLYWCRDQEECCDFGCCSKTPQHVYQTWYFWTTLFFVFAAIIASCWVCRQSSRNVLEERCCREDENSQNVLTEDFYAIFCENEGEPPSYYSVAGGDKSDDTEAPPDYNTISLQKNAAGDSQSEHL